MKIATVISLISTLFLSIEASSSHTVASKPCGGEIEYVITWGDTLSKIANTFSTTISSLMLANRDINDPDVIYAGQRICVVSNENDITWNTNCADSTKTVKEGETCFDISQRIGVSQAYFEEMNPRVNCGKMLQVGEEYCEEMFTDTVTPRTIPGGYEDDPPVTTSPEPAEDGAVPEGPDFSGIPSECSRNYTVTREDTCRKILAEQNVDAGDMFDLNPLLCCPDLIPFTKICLEGRALEEEAYQKVRTDADYVCISKEDPPEETTTSTSTNSARGSTQTSAPPPTRAPTERGEFLSQHNWRRQNALRNSYRALRTSTRLEREAAEYARVLVRRGGNCRSLGHARKGGRYNPSRDGENLYWNSRRSGDIAKDAVDGFCTGPMERLTSRTSASAMNHHTQVAWYSTREVGCAIERSSSCGSVVVCRYFPAGNTIGENWRTG